MFHWPGWFLGLNVASCLWRLLEPGEWSAVCEMSHILFITKWAVQEQFPTPRSTVIVLCCLTVNRAGKWQWLDVVAQATFSSQMSNTTANILHTFLSWLSLCPYVWHALMAITQIKMCSQVSWRIFSLQGLAVDTSTCRAQEKSVIEPRRGNCKT